MIQTYIQWGYPGFPSEMIDEPAQSRDPKLAERSGFSFGFRFFDREEVPSATDGKILKGDKQNFSGWYYYGKRMSLAEVQQTMSMKEILVGNMIRNEWAEIVSMENGACYNLYPEDKCLGEW
jgi:hypothetical protein